MLSMHERFYHNRKKNILGSLKITRNQYFHFTIKDVSALFKNSIFFKICCVDFFLFEAQLKNIY